MSRVLVACELDGDPEKAFEKAGFVAKQIAGYPHYVITECGSVFSRNHPSGPLLRFKKLSPSIDAKGYLGLTICHGGKRKKVRVHRLVADAFVKKIGNASCVRHLNGNPANNNAGNLAWGTYRENEADKKKHGTWDLRRNGTLSKDDVREIRRLYENGWLQREIAERFPVTRETISRVVNRKVWGNVS